MRVAIHTCGTCHNPVTACHPECRSANDYGYLDDGVTDDIPLQGLTAMTGDGGDFVLEERPGRLPLLRLKTDGERAAALTASTAEYEAGLIACATTG